MTADTPAAAPTAEREALRNAAERLRDAYNAATAGKWRKGLTTHHTVTDLPNAPNYKIGEFHHADDAHFCDVAHEVAPMLFRAALSAPVAAPTAEHAAWMAEATRLLRAVRVAVTTQCMSPCAKNVQACDAADAALIAHLSASAPVAAPPADPLLSQALAALVRYANACDADAKTVAVIQALEARIDAAPPAASGVEMAMEACRLLCAVAVDQENPDKVMCPPAFLPAVRAAMLALRAE